MVEVDFVVVVGRIETKMCAFLDSSVAIMIQEQFFLLDYHADLTR